MDYKTIEIKIQLDKQIEQLSKDYKKLLKEIGVHHNKIVINKTESGASILYDFGHPIFELENIKQEFWERLKEILTDEEYQFLQSIDLRY